MFRRREEFRRPRPQLIEIAMRLLKYLFLLGVLGALAGGVAAAAVLWHFSQDLPSTEGLRDMRLQVPLRIYSVDGQLLGEYGAERREPLAYRDIPQPLVQAFLAAEDDRFFEHPGVDYQGLLRAAWMLLLTGEKAQGGSTITMQLARNFFLSAEKSYVRKIKEILLAIEMEQQLSKEEILTFYLNKIFLGHRAYGIGAAAKVYYDAELNELSLSQMAMIAGLPKAPSRYNPISGPQRALLRRNYVLRRMRELDYITPEQFEEARAEPISAQLRRASIDLEANYVAEYARSRVINQYGVDAYTSGMVVQTTIHADKQRAAVNALRENLLDYDQRHGYRGPEARFTDLRDEIVQLPPERQRALLDPLLEEFYPVGGLIPAILLRRDQESLKVYATESGFVDLPVAGQPWKDSAAALQRGDLVRLRRPSGDKDGAWQLVQLPEVQGAIVAVDPRNGAVQAMVGGFDYFASKFNRAMQARRQPGSAFKPFIYSAALENGFTPASIINDAPVVFHDPALGGAWRPQNYSGRFYGPTPVREGLIKSRNLVAIRLLDSMGMDVARQHIEKFGFDMSRVPRDLSMSLGTGVFSPLEMATAYAVLANGGYRVTPYLIEKILDADGEVLHQARPDTVCDAACRFTRRQLPDHAAPEDVSDDSNDGTVEEPLPMAQRVVRAENIYLMTDMMMDVIRRGTGVRAKSLGRDDLAGKTGTTNDQRDAWFCGFNAAEVAVAWVGFDDISPLGSRETGAQAALPMWIRYMGEALKGVPAQRLPRPDGVVSARIDPATGRLASYDNPQATFEIFMEGHLPEATPSSGGGSPRGRSGEAPPSDDELIEDIF